MFMNQYGNCRIIDVRTGDVNGDNIPDKVYLIGEMSENGFYENISIMVKDGKTSILYTIPLFPNYNRGYDPWILLCNFKSDKTEQIFVSLPVGGSGALTYYYVISFKNNLVRYLLKPNDFFILSKQLGFEVIYRDYYKIDIESWKLKKKLSLDVSYKKESYDGSVYDSEGRLIKPLNGFIIDLPHLYPIKLNGTKMFVLNAQQDIAGTSHADGLGYLSSVWMYSDSQQGFIPNLELINVVEHFYQIDSQGWYGIHECKVRSQLLMEAMSEIGVCKPEKAAEVWANGLKMRSAAMQYSVMTKKLKDEYAEKLKHSFTNWVTGVSSPWVESFKIVKTNVINENTYQYDMVISTQLSTGPSGDYNAVLTVAREGDFWRIIKIVADKELYTYTGV